MGTPKALLTLGGTTFFARARAALAGDVERIVVLGGGPVPAGHDDLPRRADVAVAQGPLAGMLAAFDFAPQVAWVFAPCDLPLVSAAAVRWLLGQRAAGHWAVLPRLRAPTVEPLFAVYEPAAAARLRALAAGSGSLQPLARMSGVLTPTPPPELRAAWRNVNTGDELRALREQHGETPDYG